MLGTQLLSIFMNRLSGTHQDVFKHNLFINFALTFAKTTVLIKYRPRGFKFIILYYIILRTTDYIISINGTQNWPFRSCDLTSLNFFLLRFKSKFYENKLQTIKKPKEKIRTKIADVDQDLCGRIFQNFVD